MDQYRRIGSSLSLLCMISALSCSPPPADTPDAGVPGTSAAQALNRAWLEQSLGFIASDATEGRDNLTAGGKKTREYLIAQLKTLGAQPAGKKGYEQAFDKGVNVIGLIPGSNPALADQYVVLSAHYDHLGMVGVKGSQCRSKKTKTKAKNDKVCNGAADNGAGVAVVLAVVRALKTSDTRLKRSLLIAFWDAEEDGLLGAKHYAEKEPLVPLSRVAAMFSVDALGAAIVTGLVPFFALGTEYSSGLREVIHDVEASSGKTIHAASSFFTGSEVGGRSDHLPFRLKSVPVIFFSSGAPPEYHSAADEVAIIDYARLTDMARQVLLVTARAANNARRPSFVATPRPHIDDARALVSLGDYVMKNPAAAGLTDSMANMLEPMIEKLRGYVKAPPQTEAQWQEYQTYVKSVVNLVFSFAGR